VIFNNASTYMYVEPSILVRIRLYVRNGHPSTINRPCVWMDMSMFPRPSTCVRSFIRSFVCLFFCLFSQTELFLMRFQTQIFLF